INNEITIIKLLIAQAMLTTMIMMMMALTIAVNSNPPASERVTSGLEFNNKMTSSAAIGVTLSSLLQTYSGPAGKDKDGQYDDVDDCGACRGRARRQQSLGNNLHLLMHPSQHHICGPDCALPLPSTKSLCIMFKVKVSGV
ncbi:MAG: hypothetical protein ACKPKO_49705, partial [Candidatus Fonsibacter sp.]